MERVHDGSKLTRAAESSSDHGSGRRGARSSAVWLILHCGSATADSHPLSSVVRVISSHRHAWPRCIDGSERKCTP